MSTSRSALPTGLDCTSARAGQASYRGLGAAAVLVALLGAGTALQAATNMLANPGFETGTAAGWSAYGSHAVESTSNTYYNGGQPGGSNVLTHSGLYVGKTWGSFTGGYNANGYYQDAVAGPDSLWSASGFALSHQQDFIQTGNQFWFEVTFRDASGSILGMCRSSVLDPAGAAGVRSNLWYNLAVTNQYDIADATYSTITNTATTFAAPAGTTRVRFQILFAQLAGYPGGSFYFDDLNLTKVAGSDPDISSSPASQKRVEGQSVTFTVVAAGGSTLHYQWQKDGTDLSDSGHIAGASSATLTIANLTADDGGNYTVIVTDNAGSATSDAATLSIVTVAQASNVLENRGFESGSDFPWTRFNGGAVVAGTGDPAAGIYAGTYANECWGTGSNSWNGIFQDVPTSAGQAFTAAGWFLVSANAPITGSSAAWLEVQFKDAIGGLLGLYQSEHITSNSVTSTWLNLKATNIIAFWSDYSVVGQTSYLVAPPGAATARCQVNYHAGDGAGAIFCDDLSFFLKLPVTITASAVGTELRLWFPTQIGVSYQVLYKNDLNDANWQLLTTLTGDLSGQATVPAAIGAGKRFYRVNTL